MGGEGRRREEGGKEEGRENKSHFEVSICADMGTMWPCRRPESMSFRMLHQRRDTLCAFISESNQISCQNKLCEGASHIRNGFTT